jgi:hypothetical protein
LTGNTATWTDAFLFFSPTICGGALWRYQTRNKKRQWRADAENFGFIGLLFPPSLFLLASVASSSSSSSLWAGVVFKLP